MTYASRAGLEDPEARDLETRAAGLVKGQTACNRSACQRPLNRGHGVRWWNIPMQAWYCQSCAFRINGSALKPICFREDELPKGQPP